VAKIQTDKQRKLLKLISEKVERAQGSVSVAVGEVQMDLLGKLRASDSRFVAVPELDPRNPSTSFKVRGRGLRLDLLTPGTRDHA
jgi:hypothetical protein